MFEFKKSCIISTLILLFLISGSCFSVFGNPKSPISSGNWSDPNIWGGTTSPNVSDNITISSGQNILVDTDLTVKDLIISPNATLSISPGKRLTINGNITVNGNMNMNGGNITLGSPGLSFNLGANSVFTWDPGTNTSAEATLFTRGVENFASSSTLIIKKWFNYMTPLGSVVTGNFGNLTLNSLSGASAIVEWDQNNEFESHLILGTLTIDQGWITLDKSGSISNTTLSNVVLSSVNSTLYGHNGNRPGAFQINTGSITNTGGTIIGLNDGTGSITMKVVGNISNLGNIKVIMNSGVAGAGNGNATFIVTGTFNQSTGDTRFIYNVASTNSGIFNATFGSLNLSGGIFMGQTGCHAGTGVCSLSVTNNLTVNFTNNTDKFRGTSLSSIGSNTNTTGFTLTVGGNLTFSGPSSSEFTTSAAYGTESIFINGNLQVSGGVFSMNYGTTAAAHTSNAQINGSLIVLGGTTFLTRNAGYASIIISGDLNVSTGMLIVKASTGIVQMNVSGQFNQSSGTIYLHGNSALSSGDKITLSIGGNFTQSGGILSYDDNSSNSNATHEILLSGPLYSLSGNGMLTHAGAGTSTSFGSLKFLRSGSIQYSRSGGHQLQQVKQTVEANCTLTVVSGNIQVCSHANPGTDYFRIASNGILQLKSGQLVSDAVYANSGIQVDSQGLLSVYNSNGLYNGSSSGSISSTGNMNYFLDVLSIVEYAGTSNQSLTGTGFAMTTSDHHKYGILRINLPNAETSVYLSESTVYTRTRLELRNGVIDLNGKSFVLENGSQDAVIRTSGYVYSENDESFFVWKNIGSGLHEFPFGINSSSYIPVLFTPLSGFGNDVSISTRSTSTSDNLPVPTNLLATVLSLVRIGFAENEVIDRWWKVNTASMTANVTLKYAANENTLSLANRLSPLGMRNWSGLSWDEPRGYGFAILSGIGSVSISNVSQFSNWILAANNAVLPVELSLFQANVFKHSVRLDWTTSTEINNDFFTIERSEDGNTFTELSRLNGAGNSSELNKYSYIDENPLSGRSYYRLKQTDYDGKFTYSEIRSVMFNDHVNSYLKINTVSPNPFDNLFTVKYSLPEAGEVSMILTHSSGKLVSSKKFNSNKGENSFEYSEGSSLQAGTYILQLVFNDQVESKKLIKK